MTRLGDPLVRIGVAAMAVALLTSVRAWRSAAFLAVLVASGALVVTLLKLAFARARPELLPHLDLVSNASMPSGHAANGTIVWLGSALALGAVWPRWRGVLIVAAVAIALLIGVSRIALAVHWPSDVAVGWAIGLIWTLACAQLLRLEDRGTPSPR